MKAVCIRFSFELSVIGIDVGTKVDYNNLDDKEFKIIAENERAQISPGNGSSICLRL